MSGDPLPRTVAAGGAIAASLRLTRGRHATVWPHGPRSEAPEHEAE